jgi:hypothetical protein
MRFAYLFFILFLFIGCENQNKPKIDCDCPQLKDFQSINGELTEISSNSSKKAIIEGKEAELKLILNKDKKELDVKFPYFDNGELKYKETKYKNVESMAFDKQFLILRWCEIWRVNIDSSCTIPPNKTSNYLSSVDNLFKEFSKTQSKQSIQNDTDNKRSTIENQINPNSKYNRELPAIPKTEIKEMVTIIVNLNAKNFNDDVLIDGKIVSYKEGSYDNLKYIEVEANIVHTIKVGNCETKKIKVNNTSEKDIYPCN